MVKKFFILTMFLVIFLCAQSIVSDKLFAQRIAWKPMSPILDNNVDPSLHFNYCKGAVQSINKEVLQRFGFTKDRAKEFKSSKVTQMREEWQGSDKVVEINRWYLATPEDAAAFVFTEPITTGIQWDETPEIGDKTFYCGGHVVYFTKGNVLVRVYLNFKSLTDDKDYLKKIARSILKKL